MIEALASTERGNVETDKPATREEQQRRYWDLAPWGRFIIQAADYGIIALNRIPLPTGPALFPEPLLVPCPLVTPQDRLHWQIARQLQDYLSGCRTSFDLPIGRLWVGREKLVFQVIQTIPYGQTITYDELVGYLGGSADTHYLGKVLRHNPLPLIVPCHRVIKNHDDLGSYVWGPKIKQRLLHLESRRRRNLPPA